MLIVSFLLSVVFMFYSYYVTIVGPENSVYKNEAYDLRIIFTDKFPVDAPSITFDRQGHTGRTIVHEV